MIRAKGTSALVVAVMLLAGGCGLGQRQRQAERIHDSRERAIEAGTATGVLRFEVILDPEVEEVEGLPEAARTFSVSAAVGYDFAGDSVRLVLAPPVAPSIEGFEGLEGIEGLEGFGDRAVRPSELDVNAEPDILFTGDVVYVRRSNLRPTERRVWAKLDYTELPDEEPRINFDELGGTQIVLATAATLNPVSVLDLVVGALAGSVERGEPEDVDGVRVTRFDSNLSLDRSVTELDLPDDELEPRLLMFRLLGIFDDVRPARYWLDEDGRVRRVEAELLQRVSRRQQHELNVTLEITGYGTPIEVPVPGAEETITFERHGRLVRTVAPGDA